MLRESFPYRTPLSGKEENNIGDAPHLQKFKTSERRNNMSEATGAVEHQQEAGEWIDKEPRADGKPRRWRPFEIREAQAFISQDLQECQIQYPSDDTQPQSGTRGTQLSEAP
jgi:hypothetical protein